MVRFSPKLTRASLTMHQVPDQEYVTFRHNGLAWTAQEHGQTIVLQSQANTMICYIIFRVLTASIRGCCCAKAPRAQPQGP